MMSFTVIPAIDVRNSRVVRLMQGDYSRETVYDDSPIGLAGRYAEAGVRWLHLVDLDAARVGGYTLHSLLTDLRHSTQLKVQTGGGIRGEGDVETLLAYGAERVVIGTMAVREPERVIGWLHTYGSDCLTLALDTQQDEQGIWRLPISGWSERSTQSLDDLLQRYSDAGLKHLLCTDISRDGMLGGYNLDLYRSLAERWPNLQIQASGGVRGVEDVLSARAVGASAAVIGRALLEGHIDLAEALAC